MLRSWNMTNLTSFLAFLVQKQCFSELWRKMGQAFNFIFCSLSFPWNRVIHRERERNREIDYMPNSLSRDRLTPVSSSRCLEEISYYNVIYCSTPPPNTHTHHTYKNDFDLSLSEQWEKSWHVTATKLHCHLLTSYSFTSLTPSHLKSHASFFDFIDE